MSADASATSSIDVLFGPAWTRGHEETPNPPVVTATAGGVRHRRKSPATTCCFGGGGSGGGRTGSDSGLSGFSSRNPGTRAEYARAAGATAADFRPGNSASAFRRKLRADDAVAAGACTPGAESCAGPTEMAAPRGAASPPLRDERAAERMGPWYARPQSGSRSQGHPARTLAPQDGSAPTPRGSSTDRGAGQRVNNNNNTCVRPFAHVDGARSAGGHGILPPPEIFTTPGKNTSG